MDLQLYNDFQILDYETSGFTMDSHSFKLKIAKKILENKEISNKIVTVCLQNF